MPSPTADEQGALPPEVASRLAAMAERLRRLRMERGLRLADLAALTGVSQVHLYRLEQAERWPSVSTLLRLASAYGVEAADLLAPAEARESRTAGHDGRAVWLGTEEAGSGLMVNHAVRVRYDRASRLTATRDRAGPAQAEVGSPEELVGMALAGCFSMSLAEQLAAAGVTSERIETGVDVRLRVAARQVAIAGIHLTCEAAATGIDEARFQSIAQATKRDCVVARALLAVPVTLEATLIPGAD